MYIVHDKQLKMDGWISYLYVTLFCCGGIWTTYSFSTGRFEQSDLGE